MFSSRNKEAAPPPASQTPVPVQQKRVRSANAPSIISADLVVTGTLTSAGDIQIDGRVEGDVHSAGLVIGDKASIQGEIVAEDLTVRGRVEGNIRARKVLLASTCHVEGNILHEAFAVETGAFFEGNCRHAENPLADEQKNKIADTARRAPVLPPAPAAAPVSTPSVASIGGRPATAPSASFAPLKPNA